MLKLGATRGNLRAKAFGGSSLLQSSSDVGNFFCIGDVNIRFIKDFLANEGIPLVTGDIGGDRGRVIHFYSDDFSVHVRRIQRTGSTRLGFREKQFWQKSIEAREKKPQGDDIVVWDQGG